MIFFTIIHKSKRSAQISSSSWWSWSRVNSSMIEFEIQFITNSQTALLSTLSLLKITVNYWEQYLKPKIEDIPLWCDVIRTKFRILYNLSLKLKSELVLRKDVRGIQRQQLSLSLKRDPIAFFQCTPTAISKILSDKYHYTKQRSIPLTRYRINSLSEGLTNFHSSPAVQNMR